jgi:hypothetical protein
MIKKFVWEQWVDPIGLNKKDLGLLEEDVPFEKKMNNMPVMHTPHGPLPLVEYSGASDRFEFWVLHTNFDVTHSVCDVIAKTRGVDSVDAITRYRVRIGLPRTADGKTPIFKTSEVKKRIQDNIRGYFHIEQDNQLRIFNLDVVRKAREVRNHLDNTQEYWAIYILPNGQMDVVKSPVSNDHLLDRIGEMTAVHQLVGGLLLTSEVD